MGGVIQEQHETMKFFHVDCVVTVVRIIDNGEAILPFPSVSVPKTLDKHPP